MIGECEQVKMVQKLDDENGLSHIILIPDSFKGTLSSATICDTMADVIHRLVPHVLVSSIPVADGGEGSVAAFLRANGGEKIGCRVQGPFGKEIDSFYGLLPDRTAVIEMAAAAGLPLVGDKGDVLHTTTYGVGQLIAHALDKGCHRLIMGLGGSSTNDGGCGAAAALGVRFLDKHKKVFVPVGAGLNDIDSIDMSGLDQRLKRVELITMCDIDNPLTGGDGAAVVFSPQKGADQEAVRRLDDGLVHLARVVRRDIGVEIETLAGAGAAGGMGGGMVAFFDSSLRMGIDVVLDTVGFDKLLQTADFVFTGEGKIDMQSLRGKVVVGVGRQAKPYHVPVFAFVGDIDDGIGDVYDQGISAIFSINRLAIPFAEAKKRARRDLAMTVENVVRMLIRLGHLK